MLSIVVHSQSIKNNIANTELTTQPDRILCMQKVQAIIRLCPCRFAHAKLDIAILSPFIRLKQYWKFILSKRN